MSTISSLTTTLLNASLQPSTTTSSIGSELLNSIESTLESGGNSATQATLGGNGSQEALTYSAQGLLAQTQSNMLQTDPLLQTAVDNSSDSVTSSLLDALMPQVLASQEAVPGNAASLATATTATSSTGSASATTATDTSNTAIPGLTDSWAQILKQDPGMVGTFTESQLEQSLISNIA